MGIPVGSLSELIRENFANVPPRGVLDPSVTADVVYKGAMIRLLRSTANLAALVTSLTLSVSASAHVRLVSELKNWSWHEATLLGGVSAPTKDLGSFLPIARVPGAPPLELRAWKSNHHGSPKGLYLIIPGTGAGARSGSANLLAELAAAKGYDAIVMVNPFSADFQARWSSDGLIGFPQRDLRDVQLMVRAAYQAYVRRNGPPAQVRIMGFSLGATYTALLSQTDLGFKVSRFILLNPPVDFSYAMAELDQMMRDARNDDRFGLFTLLGQMLPFFRAAADGLSVTLLPKIREFTRRNEFENRNVIGASFGLTLMQVTNGLKATAPFSSMEQRARMNQRLLHMDFERYAGLVGVALGRAPEIRGRTFEKLKQEMHLSRIFANGRRLRDIVIVTNEDDFLVRNRDLRWLETAGFREVYSFEGGGHCGNYWTPSFKKLFGTL